MVHLSAFLIALVAVSTTTVHAAPGPLTKRIAQTISDSTKKWEAACVRTHARPRSRSIVLTPKCHRRTPLAAPSNATVSP